MTTEEEIPDDKETEIEENEEAAEIRQSGEPSDMEEDGEPSEGELNEEPAAESQPGDPASAKPEDQLQAIIEASKMSRLSPGDEERAAQLLKQTIAGGPKALPVSLDAILTLPWSAGVKAVAEAWPETKPAGRTRLLAGLAKADTEAARRIRLSLARGLYAQDPAAALKLINGVCETMGGAQGGSTTKDRQIFANVMLGKARPWIMNIAMAEMKPADAQKLITPALESCAQAPIFTQIWVLRWICDAGKFDTLPPEHIASIGKSINRWQSRWHKELRKIIPNLPESLEAALGNTGGRPAHAPVEPATGGEAHGEGVAAEEEGREEAVAAEAREEEDEEPNPLEAILAEPPRPVQERQRDSRGHDGQRSSSRDRDRQQAGPFDLVRSLREIESYVVRLRSDLQQAQAVARRREPAPDRHRGGRMQAGVSSEEMEELRRHNGQLEEQNEELRRRIEELTSDHEDRAATLEISDSLEQFKRYLGLKLKEDFSDYMAISREALNEVVRRHAHEILGRIFALLQAEGVKFED